MSGAEGSGKGEMFMSTERSERGLIALTGSTACWKPRGAGPPALLMQTVSYRAYINSQQNPAFPWATAVILTLRKGSWCSRSDNKRMLGKDQRSHQTKGNSLNKGQI